MVVHDQWQLLVTVVNDFLGKLIVGVLVGRTLPSSHKIKHTATTKHQPSSHQAYSLRSVTNLKIQFKYAFFLRSEALSAAATERTAATTVVTATSTATAHETIRESLSKLKKLSGRLLAATLIKITSKLPMVKKLG